MSKLHCLEKQRPNIGNKICKTYRIYNTTIKPIKIYIAETSKTQRPLNTAEMKILQKMKNKNKTMRDEKMKKLECDEINQWTKKENEMQLR